MKKSVVKKKYPSFKKNATFKALWEYYRKVQKDYLKVVSQTKKLKADYKKVKSDKSSSPKLIKAWEKKLRTAVDFSKNYRLLVSDARKHVKNGLNFIQHNRN